MLDAARLRVYGKLQRSHHSKALPGQLLDPSQEHSPTTTCRAPGTGVQVLLLLLLSSALVLFCWVHRAELQERRPLGHWLLSGLDVPFTVMGGWCSRAALHA